MYPFGHGLSYTEFTYGAITPSVTTLKRGEKLTVEVVVTNTGSRDGMETVHWFIADPYCSITRPVKELKHFEKQDIKAGESKTFRFDIDPEHDLSFVNGDGKRFLESGEYHILVKDQKMKIELLN
ncbi:periplasmic beta-glucosidase [Bacteroides reticulotermitis JCM 10512]|uniref:Periplasmic beta-glucosidase n=1 Tax=Bacteroides reticulotermitis JCM 10512 TaxID=1445607 RepID=W4UTG1_9BACE|nr:periplasmic beta-glucosidase [Bacteroides reticulotermitis JCM 10512]